MAASGSIITSGPADANTLAIDINEELAELYNRATWLLGSVSGTNTIVASASAWLSAYAAGQQFLLKPAADNTDEVTLNINSLGAKAVVSAAGAALSAGQLLASTLYILQVHHNGSDLEFRIVGAGAGGGGAATPTTEIHYTASGSFTKATYPGATQIEIIAIGPGGDGAAGEDAGGNDNGGGGGAGGVAIKRLSPADLAASVTITIDGTKAEFGHSPAVVGNAGSNGSAPGGGSGGTATGGDINISGQDGNNGSPGTGTTTNASGGAGGHVYGGFGYGGGSRDGSGENGYNYGGGGGGGGGGTTNSGGNGAGGAVIVKVHY